MITPIGAVNISKGLEPVKVPHFSGSMGKAASIKSSKDVVEFKTHTKDILNAAKVGAFKGYSAIKQGCKKGLEFTNAFVSSVANDIKEIGIKRGANKIAAVDSLSDKIV